MDDVNRFARELADAIAAAAADHPKVEACRERARAAGYEMRVTLEAIVGFASRDKNAPPVPKGTARVTNGDKVFLLGENESTYIPLGSKHRLENPGKQPLELIEVQSGGYLGEDDIVRFDDVYGR